MRAHFRPDTDLNTFTSLNQQYEKPSFIGMRSLKAQFQLSWTVLSSGDRHAPSDRCCSFCNPLLLKRYIAPRADDGRLRAYAKDFLFPLQVAPTSESATQFPQ